MTEPTAEQVFEWLVRNAGWSITDSDDYVQDVLDARAALVQAQADEPCVCGTDEVCNGPAHPPAKGPLQAQAPRWSEFYDPDALEDDR